MFRNEKRGMMCARPLCALRATLRPAALRPMLRMRRGRNRCGARPPASRQSAAALFLYRSDLLLLVVIDTLRSIRRCACVRKRAGWGGEVGGRQRNRIEGRRACAQSYRSSPHRNPGTYVHRPSESVKLFGKKVNITARGDKGKGRGTHRPKGRREKTHRDRVSS